MFEITLVALAFFAAGVVLEYHFALYEKAVALGLSALRFVGAALAQFWRWLLARRWLLWLGRFAAFGGALGLALMLAILIMSIELPRVSSAPTAGGEPWWMLIIAAIAALFGGLLALIGWFWNGMVAALKWFAGVLAAIAMLIPSCSDRPSRVKITPVQISPVVVDQTPSPSADAVAIHPQNGEGCIRVTRRGGYPLSLTECIAFTRESGLTPIRNRRGFLEAPRLYTSDELVHENGEWLLFRKGRPQ